MSMFFWKLNGNLWKFWKYQWFPKFPMFLQISKETDALRNVRLVRCSEERQAQSNIGKFTVFKISADF